MCARRGTAPHGLPLMSHPSATIRPMRCSVDDQAPAWQRAVARWHQAAVFTGDLLVDVQAVSRTARVFGVRSTEPSLRTVAQRALEHDDEEVRLLASQILAELARAG